MGELYGGKEAEIGRSLKSKRVQESRDRESAEGPKNSIRIVALLLSFFSFFFRWCLVRVRVQDGRGEAEVSQWTLR